MTWVQWGGVTRATPAMVAGTGSEIHRAADAMLDQIQDRRERTCVGAALTVARAMRARAALIVLSHT